MSDPMGRGVKELINFRIESSTSKSPEVLRKKFEDPT